MRMTTRWIQNYVIVLYRASGKRPVQIYSQLPNVNRSLLTRWLKGCRKTRLSEASIDRVVDAIRKEQA